MEFENKIDEAYELCVKDLKYEDIIECLKGNSETEKPIFILRLKEIKSQNDADLLISHLTNQGGMVREAVAEKIVEFLNLNYKNFFQSEYIISQIAEGLTDINPNISRILISAINQIENKEFLENKITEKLQFYLDKIHNWEENKSHIYNKLFFKLYWLLEAMCNINEINITKILPLLKKIIELDEYTTKEKVAKLIKNYNFEELNEMKNLLKQDENYYVRRACI